MQVRQWCNENAGGRVDRNFHVGVAMDASPCRKGFHARRGHETASPACALNRAFLDPGDWGLFQVSKI